MADRERRLVRSIAEVRTQTGAIWPPRPVGEETEEQRVARVAEEMENARRSEQIDLEIAKDKAERQKKSKPTATVMLLGEQIYWTSYGSRDLFAPLAAAARSGRKWQGM